MRIDVLQDADLIIILPTESCMHPHVVREMGDSNSICWKKRVVKISNQETSVLVNAGSGVFWLDESLQTLFY